MIPRLTPEDAMKMTLEMDEMLTKEGWSREDVAVGLLWVSTLLAIFMDFPVHNIKFTRIVRLVADAMDRIHFGETMN
jgi:hypothetical protein